MRPRPPGQPAAAHQLRLDQSLPAHGEPGEPAGDAHGAGRDNSPERPVIVMVV